jgi:hypothetical protein
MSDRREPEDHLTRSQVAAGGCVQPLGEPMQGVLTGGSPLPPGGGFIPGISPTAIEGELAVMNNIVLQFNRLDDDAKARVARYLWERYSDV